MFAFQKILGLFTGGPLGAVIPQGDFFPSQQITSIGSGQGSQIGNNTNNYILTRNNPIVKKLDQVVQAINNFTPVQTQVIDLPTLSRANKIGNSMILGIN